MASNRLALESSPYLRQHADNPVDWYPWGEEALTRARELDRPIFLSIGYAACHWCHVMEHESFADTQTAALLNERFVSVKVDREERPDLDAVYMAAVQAMTGSGGWPLSAFLTSEGVPFFGGTYFPPERRWGRPSFRELLLAVDRAWRERRAELAASAAELLAAMRRSEPAPAPAALDVESARRRFMDQMTAAFDPRWGGFGAAPKFPTPSRLGLLLDLAATDESARTMLSATLDGMMAGGMYDWLGGGFHRYSVDERWLVPHFEKMLYDNALLCRLYGHAGLRLGVGRWIGVARETADWLVEQMQGPEGGFHSSTDADTAEGEGVYFTWTPDEVRSLLAPDAARLLTALCALDGPPSFEHGRSVLRPSISGEAAAAAAGVSGESAPELLVEARRILLAARMRRTPPATDDKRLAAWTGMAVWALAWLGAALPEARYLDAARRGAEFLRQRAPRGGHIERAWRSGVSSGTETLEDLAWVASGWVQLGEVSGELDWIEDAIDLLRRRLPHYIERGVIFDTPDDGPTLVFRPRSPLDNAIPASSAVLAQVLGRLATLTEDSALASRAGEVISADAGLAARVPEAAATLLQAAAALASPPTTVVVCGDTTAETTRTLLATALGCATSGTVVILGPAEAVPDGLAARLPVLAGRAGGSAGEALAHLCTDATCHAPVHTKENLAALMS